MLVHLGRSALEVPPFAKIALLAMIAQMLPLWSSVDLAHIHKVVIAYSVLKGNSVQLMEKQEHVQKDTILRLDGEDVKYVLQDMDAQVV